MRSRLRARDVALGTTFLLAWIVPLAHTALAGYPSSSIQRNLSDLYSVTCLFRHRTTERTVFYVQARYADRRGYYDLDEAEYFPMEPFGHRSRFDRFMARFGYREDAEAARRELAEWIADRHAELHPDQGPIVAIRLLWGTDPIEEALPPTGHWSKPPRITRRLSVLGVYVVGPEGS